MNITIDVLIRLAALLEVEPASLILMATCLQSNEPLREGLKRLNKQLNRIKKDSVDIEMESLVSAGSFLLVDRRDPEQRRKPQRQIA